MGESGGEVAIVGVSVCMFVVVVVVVVAVCCRPAVEGCGMLVE